VDGRVKHGHDGVVGWVIGHDGWYNTLNYCGFIFIYTVLLVVAAARAYDQVMANQNGPIIDMTRNGEFIEPPKPSLGTIFARIAAFGALLLMAAVAFWITLFIIPVLLVLGVAGYFFLRYQMKRGRFVVTTRRF
jgi:hypothetical protein